MACFSCVCSFLEDDKAVPRVSALRDSRVCSCWGDVENNKKKQPERDDDEDEDI